MKAPDKRQKRLLAGIAAALVLVYRLPALLGHSLPVAGALALGTALLLLYAAACWKLIKKKRI